MNAPTVAHTGPEQEPKPHVRITVELRDHLGETTILEGGVLAAVEAQNNSTGLTATKIVTKWGQGGLLAIEIFPFQDEGEFKAAGYPEELTTAVAAALQCHSETQEGEEGNEGLSHVAGGVASASGQSPAWPHCSACKGNLVIMGVPGVWKCPTCGVQREPRFFLGPELAHSLRNNEEPYINDDDVSF